MLLKAPKMYDVLEYGEVRVRRVKGERREVKI